MSSTRPTANPPTNREQAQEELLVRRIAVNLGLPAGSFSYFRALAADAGNWSGNPYTDANVSAGRSTPGFTKRLAAAGLIVVHEDERGFAFVSFTKEGIRAAARLGIDLTPYYPEAKVNFEFLAKRAGTLKEGTTRMTDSNVTPIRRTRKAAASTTPEAAAPAPAKATRTRKAAATPAVTPSSSSSSSISVPAGYEVKWERRGGVFARNVSAEGKSPWLVVCIHGTAKEASRTGMEEGGTRAVLAERASWCKQCATEAKEAPAKAVKSAPPAVKEAPAKAPRKNARQRALEADQAKLAAEAAAPAAPAKATRTRKAPAAKAAK